MYQLPGYTDQMRNTEDVLGCAWEIWRPSWDLWAVAYICSLTACSECYHYKSLYNFPGTTNCAHWRAQTFLLLFRCTRGGGVGWEGSLVRFLHSTQVTFLSSSLPGAIPPCVFIPLSREGASYFRTTRSHSFLACPLLLPTHMLLLFTPKWWEKFNMYLFFFPWQEKELAGLDTESSSVSCQLNA